MAPPIEFTVDARNALVQARAEAAALHHELVGTEHILLALMSTRQGRLPTGIDRLAGTPAQLRREVLSLLGVAPASDPAQEVARGAEVPELPFTGRSKRAIEHSMREALASSAGTVTPAHLLLGLLLEGGGVGAAALEHCGITLQGARDAFSQL